MDSVPQISRQSLDTATASTQEEPDPQEEPQEYEHGMLVLRSLGPVMTKTWRSGQEGPVCKSYDHAKHFTTHPATFSGIAGLAGLLQQRLEGEPQCIVVRAERVPGMDQPVIQRTLHAKPGRPAYLQDTPRWFVCLDIDGAPCPPGLDPVQDPEAAVGHVLSLLPPEVRGVTLFWQLSSSAGVADGGKIKLHLWFVLDTPRTSAELTRWAKARCVPGIVDLATLRAVQIHYTAAPVFIDMEDPVKRRSGLLRGERDVATLPIPPEPQPGARPARKRGPKAKAKAKRGAADRRVSEKTAGGRRGKAKKKPRSRRGGKLARKAERRKDRKSRKQAEKEWRAVERKYKYARSTAYGRAVLANSAAELADAEPGDRHYSLFRVSARCGNFLAGGELGLRDITQPLIDAAEACGLADDDPNDDPVRTIRDGILLGLTSPKTSPGHELVDALTDTLAAWDQTERYMPEVAIGPGVTILAGDLGSGKTRSLERESAAFKDAWKHVLAVAHRRGLIRGLSGRLAISCYLDEEARHGILDPNVSRAVCLDSINKVAGEYDLVIIEESEATIHHMFYGTLPRTGGGRRATSGQAFAALARICRTTLARGGRVVACDAFAGEMTRRGLVELCGIAPEEIVARTHQVHRKDYALHRHQHLWSLLRRLLDDVAAGKRCVVNLEQRAVVQALELHLRRQGVSVKAYHGHMDVERRDELGDVATAWAESQVVLCSPSVDAGVNYDPPDPKAHFDSYYLLAPGVGRPGIAWTSLLQMMARCRAAREYHVYVSGAHDLNLDPIKIGAEARRIGEATYRGAAAAEATAKDVEHAPFCNEHWRLGLVVEEQRRLLTAARARSFYRWWAKRGAAIVDEPPLHKKECDRLRGLVSEMKELVMEEAVQMALSVDLLAREELEELSDPGNAEDRAKVRKAQLAACVGREHVTAEVLRDDYRGAVRRAVPRFVQAGLVAEGDWVRAGRRDRDAAVTGYAAHGRAEMETAAAAVAVLEAVGIDVERFFAPPGVSHSSCRERESGVCDAPTWSKPSLDEGDFTRAAGAALFHRALRFDALRPIGIRFDDKSAPRDPWPRIIGMILRWLGVATKFHQYRDGGKRVREYRVDVKSLERMKRLAAVANARARDWDIDPLGVDYFEGAWMRAVQDGKWVATPPIEVAPFDPSSEEIKRDWEEYAPGRWRPRTGPR